MIDKYALLKVVRGMIRESGEFSMREVARRIGVAPSTAKEVLDFLLSQGILERREVGRNYLFRVKNTFLVQHIKILYSLSELHASGFVAELLKKRADVVSIVLYGSVARGEDDAKSDIDILVITRKKTDIPELRAESKLRREMTILAYTYSEWKDKAERDKAFYYNVILGCIPLYGEKPVVE